ncbi:hypothetical protein BpHYR1_037240 [Brachionus plicatilis]|uniref:Uncharacterized protein n=1 Tax=Brachionus plicatilis TaxID=10195 RepID=A0A3M7T581_BRAPC|nr:hypothetical protein BpHYR1_037240 [Brachionus plicatilis]
MSLEKIKITRICLKMTMPYHKPIFHDMFQKHNFTILFTLTALCKGVIEYKFLRTEKFSIKSEFLSFLKKISNTKSNTSKEPDCAERSITASINELISKFANDHANKLCGKEFFHYCFEFELLDFCLKTKTNINGFFYQSPFRNESTSILHSFKSLVRVWNSSLVIEYPVVTMLRLENLLSFKISYICHNWAFEL